MSKYLVLLVSPLILLLGFWLFFYYGKGIVWFSAVSILVIIISGRLLAKYYFWKFKLLWLNFIIVYIAQLLFLLLLTSGSGRYILAFIFAVIWGVVWWLMSKYFSTIRDIDDRDYLAANKFFYYLGFWLLSTSLYSLIIFLNLPILYFLLFMFIAIFLWGRDIINSTEGLSKHYIWLVLFLSVQGLAIFYLLPVSFYVAGTIATLWFFYIIDSTVSKMEHFKLYLSLFIASIFILLITSII